MRGRVREQMRAGVEERERSQARAGAGDFARSHQKAQASTSKDLIIITSL